MRRLIAESGVSRTGTVARDEFLDQLDGLVYGENPREGYFEESRFLHPDLAWEFTFPSGWSTVNQRSVVAAVSAAEDAAIALALVDGGGAPDAELRDFLRGEGISGGSPSANTSGGVQIARATFDAVSEESSLRGEVAFIGYGGLTYRVLGYSTQTNWARYRADVGAAISSFVPVTDRAVLDVQPFRIAIVRISEPMSLSSFAQRSPQAIDVEELARLNRRSAGAVMSAGTRIKTVVR